MLVRLTSVLVAAVLLASCDEAPLAPSTATALTWKLESIEQDGAPAVAVPDPDRYTMQLDPDGRISIRADCNSCGGSYTLSGTSLTIADNLACTRAFCGTASLDTVFLAALPGPHTVTVSATNLTLRGSGVTLRFRR